MDKSWTKQVHKYKRQSLLTSDEHHTNGENLFTVSIRRYITKAHTRQATLNYFLLMITKKNYILNFLCKLV